MSTSQAAPALDVVFARSDRMVGRRVADEFVIVPIVGRGANLEAIYSLNPVGAFIWESLDGRRSGHAIVEAVIERFDVDHGEAEKDYRDFLAQLLGLEAVFPAG